MKHTFIIFNLLIYCLNFSIAQSPTLMVTFPSLDGIKITGDVYMTADEKAPFIILYHQARYSRGEYLEIAPKLNAQGFNCMAVDQRSGNAVNEVKNKTHERAVRAGKNTEYLDAWPDLEATLNYVKDNFESQQVIVWGSSYSSALVFPLAAKNPDAISGALSFSPGNYFELDGRSMADFAKEVHCPVFITSSKSEEKDWRPIYNNLSSKQKSFYLPKDEGFHGSKALWEKNEGHEAYWKAVVEFLNKLK